MAANGGEFAALLPDAVLKTLSANAEERRAAESWLTQHETKAGFVVDLLNLVNSDQALPPVRQATAIYLKNHVKTAWEDVPDVDRTRVKQLLVNVMLSAPLPVRRQLSAVMAIVSEYEYPEQWEELLPELRQRLIQCVLTQNVPIHWISLQGILETMYSIFERYTGQYTERQIAKEIVYSLKNIQEPLLEVLNVVCRTISGQIPAMALDANSKSTVQLAIDNADLLCKLFFCLSFHVVSEFFEDHLQQFMGNFKGLLNYENEVIGGAGDDDEPTCIDKLHTSVLEIVNLYALKHEEEFAPYLQKFVEDAWQLLTKCRPIPRFDHVVTSGIKFLTTVAMSTSHKLFSSPDVLSQICRGIVLPNIEIRDDDVELFEDNPVEYIRRNLEGSDAETRRRGAVELVRGLCKYYEDNVAQIFAEYMGPSTDPHADWRSKDLTLHIVSALAYKSGNQALGCVQVSNCLSVADFFDSAALPAMRHAVQTDTVAAAPILIADCLKFAIVFRGYIRREAVVVTARCCEKLLRILNIVIQTFAASCLEKLLFVKEQKDVSTADQPNRMINVRRISTEELRGMLPSLVRNILRALKRAQIENEYVMRLFVRTCARAENEIAPYAEQIMDTLVEMLGKIVRNPANPIFNHYLFESFSILIRVVGSPATINSFEGKLLAPLQEILRLDIAEFVPYVFQLLSHMMMQSGETLNPTYAVIMPALLAPAIWSRREYVPGAVLYLETYVRKNSQGVLAVNQLDRILGVFQKLIASKATDHHGIHLLCTCIGAFRDPLLERMKTILQVLITRLQVARTQKYVYNLLYVLSIIVLEYDVETLKKNLDLQEENLLHLLLTQVWLKTVVSIDRAKERRVYAVAMTDLACATDLCTEEPYISVWPEMISVAIALVENIVVEAKSEEEQEAEPVLSSDMRESFSTTHAKLNYGIDLEQEVPLTDTDAEEHLVESLYNFTAKHPGRFSSILASRLEPGAQKILSSYLQDAGRELA